MSGKRLFNVLVVALILATLLSSCMPKATPTPVPVPTEVPKEEELLIIGMEYISPTGIPWSAAQREGLRNALRLEYGVEPIEEGENFRVVKDGKLLALTKSWTADEKSGFSDSVAMENVDNFVRDKARLIFVTAENWCGALVSEYRLKYPDVNFGCIRCEAAPNVMSMYPRSWEGFCAACAGAAAVVDQPIMGLLGAYEDNPQVASNFGAGSACFTHAWQVLLGNKLKPSFLTQFVNSWADSGQEHNMALTLQAAGAKVVAVHMDSPETAKALAEVADFKNGKWTWAIGYDSDWTKFTDPARNSLVLTSVLINWTDAYFQAIHMTRQGNFKGFVWNPGFKEGAISLARFSPKAPAKAIEVANQYIAKLEAGWRPCGPDSKMWALEHWTDCTCEECQ